LSITRRTVLAGTAAAGAAALAGPAFAKAPMSGQQNAGFHRFKIGSFEIIAIHDGVFQRDMPKGFVRNASDADVAAAFAELGMPADKLTITFTALAVNTGDKVVLFDAGNGGGGGPVGNLAKNLAAAGIQPGDVDVHAFSHFHGDHIGGVRGADGKLVFANAEITVPEAEWAFWMDDAKMNSAPEGMKGNFALVRKQFGDVASKVRRVGWEKEVMPGITAIQADGHTPGHTAYLISSGNQQMLFVADITNHPGIFARRPEWQAIFDVDPQQAIATRKRLLDRAAADKIRLSFYHAPFPATGFVVKDGAGYDFQTALWANTL
jgi:glyoxylase-like metal-dependent hydrolase (beta-lactamase superfamily II)